MTPTATDDLPEDLVELALRLSPEDKLLLCDLLVAKDEAARIAAVDAIHRRMAEFVEPPVVVATN